jgi:DNA-binding transcriptional ArsR family regulator
MSEMPARKIRVEIYTGIGERYTITFEGRVTREKALQLLDLVELLGGAPTANIGWNTSPSELSKIDKLRLVVERRFPIGWFSSKDIQFAYEEEFREPISLSTVSTYLSRMTDRGLLAKNRGSNRRRFRILTNISKGQSFVKGNK